MQDDQPARGRVPLNTLVAFEAVARRGSLTAAAAELYITPGAVSRQIKTLESALRVELFHRRHNSIALTGAGRSFLVQVNSALSLIQNGVREISPKRPRLTLKVPITLALRWLIPRLDSFRRDRPDVDLDIRSVGLATDPADIVIRYARGEPRADDGVAFLHDRITPVCVPHLVDAVALPLTPQDVLRLPIVLDTPDGWSWQRWCEAAQLPFAPAGGSIIFDVDETAIDACLSGLGVALGPMPLVAPLLTTGELIALCPEISPVIGAYTALIRLPSEPAEAFIRWLRAQAQTAA